MFQAQSNNLIAYADDFGANSGTNSKIKAGGASTLQQGISKVRF